MSGTPVAPNKSHPDAGRAVCPSGSISKDATMKRFKGFPFWEAVGVVVCVGCCILMVTMLLNSH